MSRHAESFDTNCGPGMVYDTPDEKEIARLEKQLTTLRAALADAEKLSEQRRKALAELARLWGNVSILEIYGTPHGPPPEGGL